MQQMSGQISAPRVLLVDDQSLAAEMLGCMLEDQSDISMLHISDGRQAVTAALKEQPTVVLVDLMMPTIDGFGVIRQLRECAQTRQIPTIFLSSEDQAELKMRGLTEGANDYLVKWPHKLELVARIRYHSNAFSALQQRDAAFLSLQKSQQDLLLRTQQLAESQAALYHAQRMEAVGKLTGGVAHDFNNVLQIISSNLQLLKYELAGNETAQKRITSGLEGVKRGSLLASQLLAFGRRQPLQPNVINMGQLLGGIHELLRRSLGEAIEVETEVAEETWNALADPNQLENVILNLAINARDAMSASGKLTIAARNVCTDQQNQNCPGLEPGQYVLVSVSDTGAGMSEEVMERAFEPFFTTKPQGQGTGLGLSMAYGFVKQSGGHIKIESALGKGTQVNVYLPRATDQASAAPSQAAPAHSVHAMRDANETVLVVEDEPAVRATTVEMISKLGYRTLQAEHAMAALELLNNGVKVDVLFTDVVMPGTLRSEELAAKARALLPDIKVIFASGYVDGGILDNGNLSPGVTLLTKPYTADELARHLYLALQSREQVFCR